jgi:hypothetical protein
MRDKPNWAYVIKGQPDSIIASLLLLELHHYRHGSWSQEDLDTTRDLILAIREQHTQPKETDNGKTNPPIESANNLL